MKNSKIKIKQKEKSGAGRRRFLKNIWNIFGVIFGIELFAMISAYLTSGDKKNKTAGNNLIEAGKVSSFENNSVTSFRGGRFFLVRLNDGGFLALSLKCTHLGCSIDWHRKERKFICPCHASAFDISGNVENPPAVKALDYFRVSVENGVVKVDVSNRLERNRFEKNQVVYAQQTV